MVYNTYSWKRLKEGLKGKKQKGNEKEKKDKKEKTQQKQPYAQGAGRIPRGQGCLLLRPLYRT